MMICNPNLSLNSWMDSTVARIRHYKLYGWLLAVLDCSVEQCGNTSAIWLWASAWSVDSFCTFMHELAAKICCILWGASSIWNSRFVCWISFTINFLSTAYSIVFVLKDSVPAHGGGAYGGGAGVVPHVIPRRATGQCWRNNGGSRVERKLNVGEMFSLPAILSVMSRTLQ